MYKRHPAPAGWHLLDEAHSPGMTAVYARKIGQQSRETVEVSSTGRIGEYRVDTFVEDGVLKAHQEGDIVSQKTLGTGMDEQDAFDLAFQYMNRSGGGGSSGSSNPSITGVL